MWACKKHLHITLPSISPSPARTHQTSILQITTGNTAGLTVIPLTPEMSEDIIFTLAPTDDKNHATYVVLSRQFPALVTERVSTSTSEQWYSNMKLYILKLPWIAAVITIRSKQCFAPCHLTDMTQVNVDWSVFVSLLFRCALPQLKPDAVVRIYPFYRRNQFQHQNTGQLPILTQCHWLPDKKTPISSSKHQWNYLSLWTKRALSFGLIFEQPWRSGEDV